jgi:hypothetical protein
MTSSGFTCIFPSPIEQIKFINNHNLQNLENHNNNNFEFVEPAMLLLSLSKAEPKHSTSTNILGKRVRFNIPEETITKRPVRNVNSIYASSNNSNHIHYEINKNININTSRVRYASKFELNDVVRIIKNGNYYSKEGVITDGGNGFYSVLIDDIEEILKFRGQELELIE